MKYNVGDKVRIQPLEWYQKEIESEDCFNIFDIFWCSREMTISKIEKSQYLMEEDGGQFCWSDDMIEGLVEEEDKTVKTEVFGDTIFYPADAGERLEIIRNNDYQFVDENGNVINATKIVLEKKKKEYPKTYRECCKILEVENSAYLTSNKEGYWNDYELSLNNLIEHFRKLLICRDAYWKIAGEEMGSGISWKPSWDKCTGDKYCISRVLNTLRHDAVSNSEYHNKILAFPTAEIRDAFYENFKELIEICKELL